MKNMKFITLSILTLLFISSCGVTRFGRITYSEIPNYYKFYPNNFNYYPYYYGNNNLNLYSFRNFSNNPSIIRNFRNSTFQNNRIEQKPISPNNNYSPKSNPYK